MSDLNLDLARGLGLRRLRIQRDDADQLTRNGVLVVDERRRRPQWFDGRFLAARDLTNEQNYVLMRQADLGKAGGFGVVSGLEVVEDPRGFRIRPGHGITALGEMVSIPSELTLRLNNVPQVELLGRAFGLLRLPTLPVRTLTGLFIVALRSVEYTANPIAAYPTTIDGERAAEDGDIIEATAVTLIPHSDGSTSLELNQRRADLAYAMFVEHAERELPVGTLPLAMIAINRGVVQWIDPYLVRREVGAEHGDVLGLSTALGFASRATREAHLLQYDLHLSTILAQQGGRAFSAADYFRVLPPAGRLPRAAVNAGDFTQTYFPPGIEVDLSIIPEDELSTLVEESLVLPPIDLSLSAAQLESTSVQILIPVTRADLHQRIARLERTNRFLRPAAPGLVAARKPLEALRTLSLPRRLIPPALDPASLADQEWRQVLAGDAPLWYVRRRNFHYKTDIVGTVIPLPVEEPPPPPADERVAVEVLRRENTIIDRIGQLNLPSFALRRFSALRAAALERKIWPDTVALLADDQLRAEPFVLAGAIHEMSLVPEAEVGGLQAVFERHLAVAGKGYARLRDQRRDLLPELEPDFLALLPRFLLVPEIDRMLAEAGDGRELDQIADELLKFGLALREGGVAPVDLFTRLVELLKERGIDVPQDDPAKIPLFPEGRGDNGRVEPNLVEAQLRKRLGELGVLALYDATRARAVSPKAGDAMVALLTSNQIAPAPGLSVGAVHELARLERVDVASVRALSERYLAPAFGDGLKLITSRTAPNRQLAEQIAAAIATSGRLTTVDRFIAANTAEAQRFVNQLIKLVRERRPEAEIHALIEQIPVG